METITLDKNQIHNLLTNSSIYLGENKILEIYDGEVILNKDGYIDRISSVNLEFEEHEIENRNVIDFIRNLICSHLNLEPCEVIFLSRYYDEFQFKIQTGTNVLSKIIVYERRKIDGEDGNFYNPATKSIGLYKQLVESAYFFRWLDDL